MPKASMHEHDTQITALHKEGWTQNDICELLDLKRWYVQDAISRLQLSTRSVSPNRGQYFSHLPKVEKKCPVCLKKHMSDKATWTCAPCKQRQADEDASEGEDRRRA